MWRILFCCWYISSAFLYSQLGLSSCLNRSIASKPHNMKSALLPLLIATTLAQSPVKDYLFFNASSPAPYNGSATFLAADTNPNETHTVTFNRDNSTTSGRNWTWTLGLSNVSFPNVSSSAPPDAHVAYVTYDFSWPSGGDTIDQAVSDTQGSSCLIYLWAYFPRSVSNEYDPSSSSCESALGKECVEALTQLTLYGESNDCESQSLFLTLPACEGSLGRIVSQGAATLGRCKFYSLSLFAFSDMDANVY